MVHCVDMDPHWGSWGGQYEDTSLVKKFVLSEDEYNRRKGTLRNWERQQKIKDANFTLAKHARERWDLLCEAQSLPEGFCRDASGRIVRVELDEQVVASSESVIVPGPKSIQGVEVGMRCEVQPRGHQGVVAFVGVVCEIGGGGHWVRIKFDEPVGKTDGTARSKRYFEALPGFGTFVHGKNLQVGDSPKCDILMS